jgi:HEPN domain-containing protein
MDELPSVRDLIQLWIEKASHDQGIAELLLREESPYTDGICFHCQQAVEKWIKASLLSLSVSFKKNHNLVYLLDLLSEKIEIPEEVYDKIETLEGYAVEIRYPDGNIEPTIENARDTVAIMHDIHAFLKNLLENPKL